MDLYCTHVTISASTAEIPCDASNVYSLLGRKTHRVISKNNRPSFFTYVARQLVALLVYTEHEYTASLNSSLMPWPLIYRTTKTTRLLSERSRSIIVAEPSIGVAPRHKTVTYC